MENVLILIFLFELFFAVILVIIVLLVTFIYTLGIKEEKK